MLSDPILNFDGPAYTSVNHPSPIGDVGINYYIHAVASDSGNLFTVYDKVDGSIVAGPTLLANLGSGDCANGVGFPMVLYDHPAGRWLMSDVSLNPLRICAYVSQTNDPVSGGWRLYEFATERFPDAPRFAVWPDGYYMTASSSLGPSAYAMERPKMLAGLPARFQGFRAPDLLGSAFDSLTPSDLDGADPPPTGARAYFVRHRDDEVHNVGNNDPSSDYLEIWELDVDWETPANSSFMQTAEIPVAEFDSDLCGLVAFSCFPQPGTAVLLDPWREVVMWRSVYRNFGSHEVLLGSFVTDVDDTDLGGVRWYELRKSVDSVAWTLFQEGTLSPDTDNRWLSSIAMDREGNTALGYNITSSSTYPGLRYTGRLASDTAGTLPHGEKTLIEGSAANASNRYGDHTSVNVDPVDGCTFWFTGEYNESSEWSTRIGTFSLCLCPDTRRLADESVSTARTEKASVQIDVGPGLVVTGTGSLTLRAGHTVQFMNDMSVASGGSLTVELPEDPCL